jgi:hypothetical protein
MSTFDDIHEERIEQKFQAIEDKDVQANTSNPSIRATWYRELINLDLPPPKWTVDQLIIDAGINIISALPERFKTWFAFAIALSVANGDPLFGQFATMQTKVLIVDEESGPARLRQRLKMLGATEDTPIAIASYSGLKLTEQSANSLISYCRQNSIGLVIFDSLTRMHGADENTSREMAVVMGNFKQLAKANITVLIIHHNRKPSNNVANSGATEMRGSIEILAACDTNLSLDRRGQSPRITVTQNKNRDSSEIPAFNLEFHLEDDRCWFEYIGSQEQKKSKQEIAEALITGLLTSNQQMFQAEIILALKDSVGEKLVATTLLEMVAAGKLTPSKGARNKVYYQILRQPKK